MNLHHVIPKHHRRRLIELFVRHRYFFNQGNNTMASVSILSVEKLAIGAAALKYLFGEHVSPVLLYSGLGVYFTWRLVSRWLIGWFWHRSDGYDVETEWNKGKVPPSRVEVINCSDIAAAVRKEHN